MDYTIKEFDATIERRIVIGLIVDTKFLIEAQSLFDSKHFKVSALKQAALWCFQYYSEYGQAPGIHFQDIYDSHLRSGSISEDQAKEFDQIFLKLNAQFIKNPKLNIRYLLKQMDKLMRSRALSSLGSDLVALVSQDEIDDAELLISDYKPVKSEGISWSDPFNLTDSQFEQLDSNEDILFTLPGAIGELIGPIERGGFIGIQAPEKRGKSWWLWELGLRGVLSHCNVAFFSVGDMNEVQNWRRLYGWLLRSSRRWGGRRALMPILDCANNQNGSCVDCDSGDLVLVKSNDGTYKKLEFEQAPDHVVCNKCYKNDPNRFVGGYWWKWVDISEFNPYFGREKYKKLSNHCGQKTIRMQCYPSRTINTMGIKTILDIWEKRDGWCVDVVIIDYADILAPENSHEKDRRHQIDGTWAALRGLSLDKNIALITATQAGRKSYNKYRQDMGDASEDKRKLGHVTSMVALNQTPIEKRRGIIRLNQLVTRDDDTDSNREVVVLQSLHQSRPLLASYWI